MFFDVEPYTNESGSMMYHETYTVDTLEELAELAISHFPEADYFDCSSDNAFYSIFKNADGTFEIVKLDI